MIVRSIQKYGERLRLPLGEECIGDVDDTNSLRILSGLFSKSECSPIVLQNLHKEFLIDPMNGDFEEGSSFCLSTG